MFTQAQLLAEAQDHTTAKDRLEAIPADPNTDVDVLNAIIAHPNADNETFRLVANDPKSDHTTWLAIAQEPRSDAETLHVLAAKDQGTNAQVRAILNAVLDNVTLRARTLPVVYTHARANGTIKNKALDVFRAMAGNPATPVSELTDLVAMASRLGNTAAAVALKGELLSLVARNPNATAVQLGNFATAPTTPTDVLQAIIDRGIQTVPADVLSAILKHANSVPGGGLLGGGNTIRADIQAEFDRRASDAATTTEDLVVIAADLTDPASMQAILAHAATDPGKVTKEVLMELVANANVNAAVLQAIASSPNADQDVFDALRGHAVQNIAIDRAIIANDKVSEGVLIDIANATDSVMVLDDLVKSAKVTANILTEIVGNDDAPDAVLVQVVNHGELTQQMLLDVARHGNADVQALGVAAGHNLADEAVLIAIAGNPHVTADILGGVAQSDKATDAVLTAVADCAHAADDARWALVVASDKATTAVIANVAGKVIGAQTAMAISQSEKADEGSLQVVSRDAHATQLMLLALAQNLAATKDVLIDVCRHARVDDAVLAAVAIHANLGDAAGTLLMSPHVSDATITAFFNDALQPVSADNLGWLAQHATAPRLLTFVTTCTNKTEAVLTRIVANGNSTDEVLAAVARASDGSGNILTNIRAHGNFGVLAEAALIAHPNTDVATLRAKAQDGATLDAGLAAAAAHQNATKDVLDDVMANAHGNRGELALIAVANSPLADEQLVRAVIADPAVTDNVLAAVSEKIDLDAIAGAAVFTQTVLRDLIAAPQVGPATIATMGNIAEISEAALLAFIPAMQSPALLTFIAQQHSENVTEGVLDVIANNVHSDDATLATVARHTNATQAVLTTVVGAGAYGVEAMEAVAGNREASEAMLNAIARNAAITAAQAGTLAIIARRDGVSEGVLDSISRRNRPATAEVLGVVAAKTTDVATLNRVANHANRDAAVLQAVVANEHADEAALNVAAQHLAVDDMAAVVGHDHATDVVYQQAIATHGAALSADVLETIAQNAQDVQTLRDAVALNPVASVLAVVARNDQADAALLQNIVASNLPETFAVVASHANTDIAELQTIVASPDATGPALIAIAGHANADPALLINVLRHDNARSNDILVAIEARGDAHAQDPGVVAEIRAFRARLTPASAEMAALAATALPKVTNLEARYQTLMDQAGFKAGASSLGLQVLQDLASDADVASAPTFIPFAARIRQEAAKDKLGVEARAVQQQLTAEDADQIVRTGNTDAVKKYGY